MPPRLPFSRAPSQWLPRLFPSTSSPSAAPIHTSPSTHAIKDTSSASRSIMNLDRDPNDSSRRSNARPGMPLRSPNDSLRNVLHDAYSSSRASDKSSRKNQANVDRLQERTVTTQYVGQMPRKWRPGDAYSPHDLGPEEVRKFRRSKKLGVDLVDTLGLNPLDEYRNFAMISEFITPTGRIMHSKETGLRPVNQRKMAKAIRRAIGMGLHPSVHRHPEIIQSVFRNLPQTIADKGRPYN